MSYFNIKQNDLRPPLKVQCSRSDTGIANLTTATSVKFIMRKKGEVGTPKISRAAAIENAATGIVRHDWLSGDTDTEGTFYGEFEVTWPDGDPETFPNYGYIKINIGDDLG